MNYTRFQCYVLSNYLSTRGMTSFDMLCNLAYVKNVSKTDFFNGQT